jgi:hypothetical protein
MPAQPCGRFEWERIVRRIVMPERVKFLALLLATFADGDGSRIRPGLDQIAAMMGRSKATTKRNMAVLRSEYGLLEEIARGGGRGARGRASEYRLVVPEDLLERVELLDPDGSRRETGLTQVSPESLETGLTVLSPVMESTPVDNPVTGLTRVSPVSDGNHEYWAQITPFPNKLGSFQTLTGLTLHEPLPVQDQPPKRTTTNPDPARPPLGRAAKCEHGLSARRRKDGTPTCALCRRETQEAAS